MSVEEVNINDIDRHDIHILDSIDINLDGDDTLYDDGHEIIDLDVDLPTLAFPLDMCLHVSHISSNDNWYTSPILMRSRRSINTSLIVVSKRVFSVSNPK